jgi:hypothetical protein
MEKVVSFLKTMDERELDPLLAFVTVIGMERIAKETCLGPALEVLLLSTAENACVTVEELLSSFRGLFYGTKREGKMGVSKVRSVGEAMWRHSKKKHVMQMYLDSPGRLSSECSLQLPCLIQIIYAGKDRRSGARVHQIFKNAQDGIIACRDMLLERNPPLALMEVPTLLQGMSKFYVDWDMTLTRLEFLEGSLAERVDQVSFFFFFLYPQTRLTDLHPLTRRESLRCVLLQRFAKSSLSSVTFHRTPKCRLSSRKGVGPR